MKPNRLKAICRLLAALACLAALTACPTRELPSQPQTTSETASDSSQTVERMPIILANAPRRGPMSKNTTPTPPGPGTPTRVPTSAPTRTAPAKTPTRSATAPPPTPTRTPTSAAPTLIRLRAVRWAWQWVAGPGTSTSNPSPSITLKAGRQYSFHVFDGDISDPNYEPHMFSGVLGVLNGVQLSYGAADVVQVFTAPMVTQPTTYGFSCGNDLCVGATGNLAKHEGMLGTIIVTP